MSIFHLVSPIDPLPDIIPILGHIDDLIVTAVALAIFLAMSPREVVLEHFRGRGGEPVDAGAPKSRENVIEGEYHYVEDEASRKQ